MQRLRADLDHLCDEITSFSGFSSALLVESPKNGKDLQSYRWVLRRAFGATVLPVVIRSPEP